MTKLTKLHADNKLTDKEEGIVRLVAQGHTNKQIGVYMGTTEEGIKNCLRKIFDKTGCESRLALALWYAAQDMQ